MATFPGSHTAPNPLGFKAELLGIVSAGVWTDITQYVMLRNLATITNMGRVDESGSITPSTLTLTLKNTDGRFTPKNTGGAYTPNILRNTQIRISVNATSTSGVAYSGFRFWGEIASWPPGYDVSQHDIWVDILASGIWRRIQSSTVPIGSCYWRYANLLTGTSVPAAWWAMEDGSGSPNFALTGGTGTNMIPAGTPSYAGDGTSFPGSNALPTMNGARLAANVSSAATPTNNVFRFALSVPATNDSSFSQFTLSTVATMISSAATIKRVDVTLSNAGQLTINGYTSVAGGATAFTGTITTKVNGVPVLVSVEITPSGGSINWAMRIIKPGAGSVLDQVSGTRAASAITAVTQIQLNPQGRLQDTAIGQAGAWYVVPALTTAASNIGGQAGELAADRITRLCTESNIPLTLIGSGGAACGPQVSDTMSNVLTSIEATDGGLLYETTGQFGLGYRTLASMQNQAAALTLSYTSGALGAPLTPTYDDQLIRNQWTVQNTPTNYSTTAQLNSGAISIQPPPNGVGQGYAQSKSINANANSQADAIATQLLKQGTVDDVRFPVVYVNFLRTAAASFFSSIPSLRIGDFFQISNLPAFLGGGTTKQIALGYTETIGGDPETWTFSVNAVPELPFETAFSPGSFTVLQGAAGGVPQGSSVGSTVNGSQVGSGAVGGNQAAIALSARSIGGTTQFISAATPYKWSFAVTGTPADNSYFSCTSVQSLPIAPGDTFSNTGGLGSPFTVTSVDQVGSGVVNVHFTPDATSVMSTGTVQGGTSGDQWVNTSAGNQVNQWGAGAWNAITWNAHNVITAGSITATEIQAATITASQIAAGIVIAGVVDGTVIQGATIIADGTSGEILVYSGTPALGNLIGSWSGASGSDTPGNTFPAGLAVEQGALVLFNQGSAPSAVSGASSFYSSVAGRPRYLSQSGNDSAIERSTVNVAQFSMGTQTVDTIIGGPLNYLAGEASQSSEFGIEIDGIVTGPTSGSGTVPTYNMALFLDGSSFGAAFTLGGVMFGPITTHFSYSYTIRFTCAILTSGASGTAYLSADGQFCNQTSNLGNTSVQTAAGASSGGLTKSIDTTVNHTLQVYGSWSSVTSTGHSVKTYRTRTIRRM
jgi:hypothetical protein